jgi:hypothetical protein
MPTRILPANPFRRKVLVGLSAAVCGAALARVFGVPFTANEITISAADFGAVPDGADAGPGLARACAAVARNGGGRLVIAPGVYRILSKQGAALFFNRLANIEIVANGAELVFAGLARPLVFRNCSNVRVTGLTISWARPPFSQGDIKSLSADGKTVEIALDAATPMDGWTKVEAIGSYDRSSGLIQRRGVDAYDAVQSVEMLSPSVARLNLKWPIGLERAKTLVLRHATYEACAMSFGACATVNIEDVTVHSAPGAAFVAGNCRDMSLRRCVIAPKDGLLMSICADGAHLVDCGGQILLEDCSFSKMGDDGVNVNSAYWRVVERPDGRTVLVSQWRNTPFQPDQTPAGGDLFEFASGSTLEKLGEARLANAAPEGPTPITRERLRFATDVPGAVGDLVVNESHSPRVLIRNCRFENNRARGVLAHRDTLIENCLFLNQSAQGVLLAPDEWWMEGPEVANVQILGNTFDGVDRWGQKLGAIYIDAMVTGPDGRAHSSPGRPNHDITIKDNVFKNIDGPEVVERDVRP